MSNRFSVGSFGYGGNVALIELFREELELAGIEIKTCHEYPSATTLFDPSILPSFIDSCDVILLPARCKLQPAKSVNRLALAWSRKKACIVSPLPSYLEYVIPQENALIADTKEEWLNAIFKLRDNLELRNKLAVNGYQTAISKLHPFSYVDKLFTKLRQIDAYHPWPLNTFLQIIIPHYAPRLDYVTKAVKSALESIGPERDILVVSSSKIDPTSMLSAFNAKIRCIHIPHRLSFSEANNLGLRSIDPKASHILFLNDDAILSKTCLSDMVTALINNGDSFILNPYSNCDKRWLHDDVLKIKSGKELFPGMAIEDFTYNEIDELAEGFISNRKYFEEKIETNFCAFYATLIPRYIIDKVGFLNTTFKNGGEDLDYCERAKRLGFPSYWTTTAQCFHFGGKTRKVAENEDYTKHHEEDKLNNLLVVKRWPKGKKRIAIWTGPAWESKWDLESYLTTGIGGSETCAGRLAETAASDGHSVYMYGAHDRKEQNGVQLVPWNEFIPEEEYFDLFIASRNLNCIDDRLRAKNILVWAHDIWLLSGQHVSDYHRSRVSKFVCLSPWHLNFFADHHKLDKSHITVIPNGINVELFNLRDSWENAISRKKYGSMLFSSSPDRGLDNLLYVLPFVKDHVPELTLNVFYGFYNWESAARSRGNTVELQRIDELKSEIEKNKDWVNLHGRVSQSELAKYWYECYLWGYLSVFTETFAITAKEAQLSATPMLTSNEAALQTTVGDYGIRIFEYQYSREGRQKFVDEAVKLFKDKDYWVKWSKKSYEGSKNIDWRYVWDTYWSKWI